MPARRPVPQGLNDMQYIAYAQRGEFEKCADESFDCVMCGICSSRCPAQASPIRRLPMLARRLNGKYLAPHCDHLDQRVKEIAEGKYEKLIEDLMDKPLSEIKELYNHREIEA
jgi:ferredoxin